MGGAFPGGTKNVPSQYAGRKRQYLGAESASFINQYSQYASDFFDAQAQGLEEQDFYAWRTVSMRMSDIIKPSASMTRHIDDYKEILIADSDVDYIPPGAKFVTMGSTWLCVNPENISSAYGTGILQRCNAVWNHLDWYGNVLSEPVAVEQQLAKASTPDPQDHLLITKGYYDVKCQYNEHTAQLGENSRLILGGSAYMITGFTDFIQEFTGDYGSVRLLQFSIRYEEPNAETDDMENHVAGGKTFSWDITVSGAPVLMTGSETVFTASSERRGVTVESSEAHPITYLWASSDESVAVVDAEGTVKAVGAGSCEIICTLAQNTAVKTSVPVSVEEASGEPAVRFLSTVPEEIAIYGSAEIKAAYFANGAETDEPVVWDMSGAPAGCFRAATDGNSLSITCYGGSVVPLTVTASAHGISASAEIWLRGL